MKQIFTPVKIVQLSALIYERMRKNEKKPEEKIRPPDSISGQPFLHFRAALTPFRGSPNSLSGRPWLHFGAALVIESGGLIFSSRFSSFLLILTSVRGESCTILTSIKICFRQDRHAELVNYPFRCLNIYGCSRGESCNDGSELAWYMKNEQMSEIFDSSLVILFWLSFGQVSL